ncbi:hypothetical protein JKP88DRAFT_265875 [Tribonema minus]|uniref:Zn(2)-C6 fungal-type domain-containing protein n=1 Tax=Tribonema minus TaxID=303371 RepID=A0A835YH07_9STRA|nr:hypothetical protein JKP88DRAFT_265875 [Tribonema minus]
MFQHHEHQQKHRGERDPDRDSKDRAHHAHAGHGASSSSSQGPGTVDPAAAHVTETIGRSQLRNACDWCHSKRIKCRHTDGPKCQQCLQRGLECKFSVKEKTGPKPKVITHNKGQQQTPPQQKQQPAARAQPNAAASASRAQPPVVTVLGAPPVPSATQQALEWGFLRAYATTVTRLLPLGDPEALHASMLMRAELHATLQLLHAPPPPRAPVPDGQLMAALAVGALVCNQPLAAEAYAATARSCAAEAAAAAGSSGGAGGGQQRGGDAGGSGGGGAAELRCMLALYWHCVGDADARDAQLRESALLLQGSAWTEGNVALRMCIEHLDANRAAEAHAPPPSTALRFPPCAPALSVLGLVTCVLRDIPELMASTGGELAAVYARQLAGRALVVEAEEGHALPALACRALQALLLMLLGRLADATAAVAAVPPLLDANPLVARCLPLAWDMAVLAAATAFVLGCNADYVALHRAVEWAQGATAATQWACRLPSPECPLRLWISHTCARAPQSCLNVCDVVSQAAIVTQCGAQCMYASAAAACAPPGGSDGGDSDGHEGWSSWGVGVPPPPATVLSMQQQQQQRRQQAHGGGGGGGEAPYHGGQPLEYHKLEEEEVESVERHGSSVASTLGELSRTVGELDRLASIATSYLEVPPQRGGGGGGGSCSGSGGGVSRTQQQHRQQQEQRPAGPMTYNDIHIPALTDMEMKEFRRGGWQVSTLPLNKQQQQQQLRGAKRARAADTDGDTSSGSESGAHGRSHRAPTSTPPHHEQLEVHPGAAMRGDGWHHRAAMEDARRGGGGGVNCRADSSANELSGAARRMRTLPPSLG